MISGRLKFCLAASLVFLAASVSRAQQIEVLDFAKFKPSRPGLGVDLDKTGAIIDFTTGESGFTFLADGKTQVQVEEGEGSVRVTVPHKTSFLTIEHPDFGRCIWKSPLRLRRFKHYSAYLKTYSPDKLYKLSKQWLTLSVWPQDAIVVVDSTTALLRDGKAQFNLPLGTHRYTVEAPFYKAVTDSVTLTDSAREDVEVHLQPFYSYLTVKPGTDGAEVYLDRALLGRGEITSGRIVPGEHRLTVIWDDLFYYDSDIEVGLAEKKVISLERDSVASPLWQSSRWGLSKEARAQQETQGTEVEIISDVQIAAPGPDVEILINREYVGKGSWSGRLPAGFYAVSARSGGVESGTEFLRIGESSPVKLSLAPPETYYATLSIHSNVIGAGVFLNGELKGETPCVIGGLPELQNCRITLRKEGYRDATVDVRPYGNDLTDVNIKMKERKGSKK